MHGEISKKILVAYLHMINETLSHKSHPYFLPIHLVMHKIYFGQIQFDLVQSAYLHGVCVDSFFIRLEWVKAGTTDAFSSQLILGFHFPRSAPGCIF